MSDSDQSSTAIKRTLCAACGQPRHRYGRNEGMDRFDPQACINLLLSEVDRLRDGITSAMAQLAEHAVHERDGVALDISCDLLALVQNGSTSP